MTRDTSVTRQQLFARRTHSGDGSDTSRRYRRPMHTTPMCKYMSRVVDLTVDDAASTFDAWTSDRRGHRLAAGSGSLRIDHVSNGANFPGRALGPVARAYGWLRTRAFAYARVEIELSAWSTTRSEVGLRYAGRRRPGYLAARAYNQIGPDVIDDVATALAAGRRAKTDRRAA